MRVKTIIGQERENEGRGGGGYRDGGSRAVAEGAMEVVASMWEQRALLKRKQSEGKAENAFPIWESTEMGVTVHLETIEVG